MCFTVLDKRHSKIENQNTHIDELIAAFLTRKLDQDSIQELMDWVSSSPDNKTYFRQQLDMWSWDIKEKESHLYDEDKAFEIFKERVAQAEDVVGAEIPENEHSKVVPLLRRWNYKIAVAAILFCVIGVVGFFQYKKQDSGSAVASNDQFQSFIQISVPSGERKQYTLPDSSVVWLNAGSVFKYPTDFNGKTRDVYLDGEGYFQVSKDKQHPFIVYTPKGNITVTGTTFNVNSYTSRPGFVTALLEGKVSVQTQNGHTVHLVPLQKSELKDGVLSVSTVSDPDEYKWMEGLICFDNEPITEVLKRLEASFGEKITIEHLGVQNLRLSGKFRINDGLDYALKVLAESYGLKYKHNTNNKEYTILN